ncbi:MAG: polysaccharide deacetylase family protein, partial [Candidatus Eremiobacteraeota bacterium]|nr:polysaccharide deacetylase family protein [Candidatus Eremiobacteraeota bacterium]
MSRARLATGATVVLALVAFAAFEAYEFAESPGNQLFGKTLVSGPRDERVVALTYDDGPNPPYTTAIVDVLRKEHVHATFFVVGQAVAAYPAIVRREARDGNAIGNHTWAHEHLVLDDSTALRETLEKTDRAIYAVTRTHTRIMRPPYGGRDWLVLGEVRKL